MTYSTDAATRLGWALRRALPLLLGLCLLGGVGVTVAVERAQEESYVAPALVVVATLGEKAELRSFAEQLPHYAQAVFADGGVAERAFINGRLPIEPDVLVRDYVRVEPV